MSTLTFDGQYTKVVIEDKEGYSSTIDGMVDHLVKPLLLAMGFAPELVVGVFCDPDRCCEEHESKADLQPQIMMPVCPVAPEKVDTKL